MADVATAPGRRPPTLLPQSVAAGGGIGTVLAPLSGLRAPTGCAVNLAALMEGREPEATLAGYIADGRGMQDMPWLAHVGFK